MQTRLAAIKDQIATYESKYGIDRGTVALLAVSKKQPVEKIRDAYDAGQRLFGENYLQEALQKMAELADCDIEWHFIGPIQSNKTRKIAENFHWVQSVDSVKIAKRLSDQRPEEMPPLNICLEVNISGEASKSGVTPDAVAALAQAISGLPNLKLRGLMAIPAPGDPATDFRRLREQWESLKAQGYEMDILSMGMSADFEQAIAEGSNMIRIGAAIFGNRT